MSYLLHCSPARRWMLLALTLTGLVVLGVTAWRSLLDAAIRLTDLGPLALVALPLFVLWTIASALGWRAVIVGAGVRPLSLLRLFLIRIQAQSVNLVLPLVGLGGDALRVSVLAGATRQAAGSLASVALDMAASIVACLLFAGLGTLVGWSAMQCSEPLRWLAVVGALVTALVVWFLPLLAPRLARWSWLNRRAGRLNALAVAIGQGRQSGYGRAIVWHIIERLLIVGEAWLYARALGVHLSLLDAVFATALMTVFSSALFFVPGQMIAADGGLALGLTWAGVPFTLSIAVALARRLRQLLVGVVGMLVSLGKLRRKCREHEGRPNAELVSNGLRVEG